MTIQPITQSSCGFIKLRILVVAPYLEKWYKFLVPRNEWKNLFQVLNVPGLCYQPLNAIWFLIHLIKLRLSKYK